METEDYKLEMQEDKMGNKYYFPPSFLQQLKELLTKFGLFILIPGLGNRELENRNFVLNRLKSKRNFAQKLKAPLTILGIFLIFLIFTAAFFAPYIAPYDFYALKTITTGSWNPPSPDHILGQGKVGRDVFSRLIWGARSSVMVGTFSVAIAVIFGVILGIFSAYQGGWIDSLIMRFVDIIMAFPGIIIVIIIVSIFGQRLDIILLVYGILGIPGYARLIRGNVLQEKTKTYVEAAKVAGANNLQIMFKHILPNAIAPVLIAVTFALGAVVLGLAGLSFLGFGDQTVIDWGFDIADARSKLYMAPWAVFWPGFGIFISVLGFMLFGDGLRDALDPRLQGEK